MMSEAAATHPSTPPPSPDVLDADPIALGRIAAARRQRARGSEIRVWPAPGGEPPAALSVVRDGETLPWTPDMDRLPTDRLLVAVHATAADRQRFVNLLRGLSDRAVFPAAVAPYAPDPGGLHRLWAIAAARAVLPPAIRVEARHDLIGIRLCQIALGFGADAISGPIHPDRVLPLAGVTRPAEDTLQGLSTLVEQAGLTPVCPPFDSPEPPPR